MAPAASQTRTSTPLGRVPHGIVVPLLLAVAGVLAVTSLLGDSITFDETAHLTAGFSYLKTGDYRLQPEHPALPNMWAALPLLWMDHNWPPADTPGWRSGEPLRLGRAWLFEAADGERLLTVARCMRLSLLLATCAGIYAVARRLFGRDAGLLALIMAILSPTLLAHGRLVTSDVPAALAIALAFLTLGRCLERITWSRLVPAALAAAALPLVKFSWILALPGLLLMVLVTMLRLRPRRAVACGALAAVLVLTSWAAIWACYGFRYSAFRGPDRDDALFTAMPIQRGQRPPATREQAWEDLLHAGDDKPVRGVAMRFVRFARDRKLLPEAYLYGLALTLGFTGGQRPGYLNGEVYSGGRRAYFPIAFALKTPIATLALLLLGVATIVFRNGRPKSRGANLQQSRAVLGPANRREDTPALSRIRALSHSRDPTLLVGLVAFATLFAVVAVSSNFNIGHRHLVPLYPIVFVFAGAAAAWLSNRVGQVVIAAAVAWVAFAALKTHPHYLPYFNEFAGGSAHGQRYLADSNIDWGQDLKRLARYAKTHRDERIKLAYFGSADPRRYGFACEPLPSYLPFGERLEFTPATYVISVNHLVGLCDEAASEQTWRDEQTRQRYRELYEQFAGVGSTAAARLPPRERAVALQRFWRWRWGRLLHQLRRREPDARIGYSLFVFRLTQDELDRLTLPP